jgi:hypothetical protein
LLASTHAKYMIKISITDSFFSVFCKPGTQQTPPRLIILFFFLFNLNFLLSKSRFYTSSNTKLFVYKLKNAALRRLAMSCKPIGHLNVRSLFTSFNEFTNIILRNYLDIVAVSETWLSYDI